MSSSNEFWIVKAVAGTGLHAAATPNLAPLEVLLGHHFNDPALLARAVTHSSLAYEQACADALHGAAKQASEETDNEQLEFLGDAVVGLIVAELLCKRHPELQEGQLTRLRAALVSRNHLGEVAALLDIGQYLRLGRGEERSGGRKKKAILANCIEAILGALYLDAGIDAVRVFVEREIAGPYLGALLKQMDRDSTIFDHKSALQELLQARHQGPPRYEVKSESGPDHRKRFVVEVSVGGGIAPEQPVASGQGATKKKAEQEAARRAFEKLRGRAFGVNDAGPRGASSSDAAEACP